LRWFFVILLEIAAMSHLSIRPWAGALPALAVFLVTQHALPLSVAAQQPPPEAETQPLLQGVVVHETTGQPVESATVSLIGTDVETQTGRFGDFAFPDVQLGAMAVRVTAPGHPSVTQDVNITGDGIVFLQFRLPSVAAVLSELLVGVPRERSIIAEPETAADLLGNKVPGFMLTNNGIVGRDDDILNLRGARSFGLDMQPHVFIDGVMVSGGETAFEALRQIPASDVLGIEVLRGPAAAFRYPLAANGVVLVTTR
jgi:hypothetical protein